MLQLANQTYCVLFTCHLNNFQIFTKEIFTKEMWSYEGKISYSWLNKVIQMYPNYFSLLLTSPSAPLKVKENSKCKGENYRLLKYIVWKSVHFSNISNALHNSWWSKWRGCNIIEDNTIRKSVWIFHSISFSFFSSETRENYQEIQRTRDSISRKNWEQNHKFQRSLSSGSRPYIWRNLVIIQCSW